MRLTMFGLLRVFLSYLAQYFRSPLDRFEQKNCRLLTAALLIRVARVENEMSEARRKKLHAALKSRFELDDCSTNQLISDAVVAERSATSLAPAHRWSVGSPSRFSTAASPAASSR